MSFVYILLGENKKYYIGSTVDLRNRLLHHEGGHTPSTKKFGKVVLVFSQEYITLKEARTIELRLKKLKRRDYIEKIICDGIIKMKL